jgi:hypothetical protein
MALVKRHDRAQHPPTLSTEILEPDHLPRRRVVHLAPSSCPSCGSTKFRKIGKEVTKTLDVVPRRWFVTEHVTPFAGQLLPRRGGIEVALRSHDCKSSTKLPVRKSRPTQDKKSPSSIATIAAPNVRQATELTNKHAYYRADPDLRHELAQGPRANTISSPPRVCHSPIGREAARLSRFLGS